ncbi:MAG: hypothetical protein J5953_15130 [Prevotella sp.]|nr:hypothetical protein [Prevotella sp.]
MMKKLIFMFVLCCSFAMNSQAQEVWKEVRRLAKAVADNPDKDLQSRKIATFKVDALDYMKQRYYEAMLDSSVTAYNYKLDHQAYALYDFVNQFVDQLSKQEKKKDKQAVIDTFKRTSLENCKFFDLDKELVEAYILRPGDYLTQFSLDTDWEKANEEIKIKIRLKAFDK